MKRVLLIGIYGTYNYGCEAIIRGTVNILKSIDSSIEVVYASLNGDDDRKRLKGCDVVIVDRPPKKKWTIHNIIRKLLSFININYIVPYDHLKWINGFDAVFSIGGDLYTLNPDRSFDQSLPRFLERCQDKGMKYYLWGASVGKFEDNPKALRYFKNHLPKIDVIFTREPNTFRYLTSIGIAENMVLAPDPAYFVRKDNIILPPVCERNVIGINLSPLSALYEYGDIARAVENQRLAIEGLLEFTNYNVILIPHVISKHSQDDDYTYLQNLYQQIYRKYPSRISIIDNDPGFLGLTEHLMKCKVVIAARMHCAVNALSIGVPALFLSYSAKAIGMSQFIYGTDEGCIPLSEFENTKNIIRKIESMPEIDNSYKNFDFKTLFK